MLSHCELGHGLNKDSWRSCPVEALRKEHEGLGFGQQSWPMCGKALVEQSPGHLVESCVGRRNMCINRFQKYLLNNYCVPSTSVRAESDGLMGTEGIGWRSPCGKRVTWYILHFKTGNRQQIPLLWERCEPFLLCCLMPPGQIPSAWPVRTCCHVAGYRMKASLLFCGFGIPPSKADVSVSLIS